MPPKKQKNTRASKAEQEPVGFTDEQLEAKVQTILVRNQAQANEHHALQQEANTAGPSMTVSGIRMPEVRLAHVEQDLCHIHN